MAKDRPEPRAKEARVAGIKNKLRRAEEMKKVRREKKKACTVHMRSNNFHVGFFRKKGKLFICMHKKLKFVL